MTNKILAKWAHFIKHEISTIVTKTKSITFLRFKITRNESKVIG